MFDRAGLPAIGIWTDTLEGVPAEEFRGSAAEIEHLGYGVLWLPEGAGRDPFVALAIALSATEHLVGATGIANIWARDAVATATAARTLAEAFPGRQLIGLGVSHQVLVSGMRGHDYAKPYTTMKSYLEVLHSAPYGAHQPQEEPVFLLAALRHRMLELARTRTAGAHPYLVTPEHTASAREILGRDRLLAPTQAVVLDEDETRSARVAREYLATYLALPNYVNSFRAMGFGDDDLEGGGSDRLVDALVVRGGEQAVADRIKTQLDAGADHVALHVLSDRDTVPGVGHARGTVPMEQWRRLAALNSAFA
ncbi:TIGR03620 family F420-dependent LLM class oxidoreductase [Amycolatopsis jiangsuensis]|uniref:Putative F420-dependent oxidoreductase n=1 Tax=Amycolatopsis jiangsuensis TaxID=1181879 RepID=A0A840J897_9PSEU|nr:TIGR03620 family F420-dependent LLM class oxidoreductase [Amycolatopsis jiangsuensis]MBB4689608.1 putative F420-dependent oxidoreductase [Amycolatopsis jiangsuensis]